MFEDQRNSTVHALYDKIGRSFNKGHIKNDQYDFEQKVRENIYSNDPKDFISSVKDGDVVEIFMFGGSTWVISIHKVNGMYFFKCFHTEESQETEPTLETVETTQSKVVV